MKSLKILLNRLDEIATKHEELLDTDVRERMRDAIDSAFLSSVSGYELPNDFGMFEPKSDAMVKAALANFIDSAKSECHSLGLVSWSNRLNAFQNIDVESSEGNTYDEYFGHDPSFDDG